MPKAIETASLTLYMFVKQHSHCDTLNDNIKSYRVAVTSYYPTKKEPCCLVYSFTTCGSLQHNTNKHACFGNDIISIV